VKQRHPEAPFQRADLLADGGLCQAEFAGRRRETEMAGGGLEDPEPVQRRGKTSRGKTKP